MDRTVCTVALVNDFEIVLAGLRQMFRGHPSLRVVELDSGLGPWRPIDIALVDTFGRAAMPNDELTSLVGDPKVTRVAVYTWSMEPQLVEAAVSAGADGYLSKELGADELMAALTRIHAGERVISPVVGAATDEHMSIQRAGREWPGREQGLTYRESEVLSLIAQGLSNQEICERLFLSINSVKSYIRTAYRKLGLERRSQAILWALDHGLQTHRRRYSFGEGEADDEVGGRTA